jgi:hypothetical protein
MACVFDWNAIQRGVGPLSISYAPVLYLKPSNLLLILYLQEWAWFRSDFADSGWSAVGCQTQSAYVRGGSGRTILAAVTV